MINKKYHGISLRLTNLLENYKQIGGDIKKITIDDHEVTFNMIYNNDDDETSIQLLTIDGSLQCGIILIDKENPIEAIFQDVHAHDNCYDSTIENMSHGKIIVKLMIALCKKYGIKKILLSDNSRIVIDRYDLDLKLFYTMTHGYPWYVQFGFKNMDKDDYLIMKKNYKLLKGKKVSDFDKNVFIDQKFIKLAKDNMDMSIKQFIKEICNHDIKLFHSLYEDIYKNLGLIKPKHKQYYLNF